MKEVSLKEGLKKRHPTGVCLVVCKDKKGMVDVTPVGWFTICNSKPLSWAISLHYNRYSYEVILKQGEFVLTLPSYKQKEDVLYCGSVSGRDVDKLKKCKFELIKAKKVEVPLLKDSIACYECKVIRRCDITDHTIFVGKILAAYISEREDKIYSWGEHNLFKWEKRKQA